MPWLPGFKFFNPSHSRWRAHPSRYLCWDEDTGAYTCFGTGFMALLLAIVFLLLLACDESGGLNEEVYGRWEHLSDSVVTGLSKHEYLPADIGIELETFEFNKDGSFEQIQTFSDSVAIIQGSWWANYEYIDLEYPATNSKRYTLAFYADRMRHAYSYSEGGYQIWFIKTYARLE